MKQLLTLAVAFFSITAITKATPANKGAAITGFTVPVTGISIISVSNGINLVLTEDAAAEIKISGEEKYVSRVSYSVSGSTLSISSKKGTLKNKITVTVPVQHLQVLVINDNSSVSNLGWIYSDKLKVILNGTGSFELYTKGEILVEADEAIDLYFDKWTKQLSNNQ